ncbi:MAG: hypothetical protein K0R29_993 [Pseudobdellovibrio sp.]|jgi:hypothetical protein|nr:hypothetical protein [Pseudobdellovibrio sp.]
MHKSYFAILPAVFLMGCTSITKIRSAPVSEIASFDEVPLIGFTDNQEGVRLGGFSALQFVERENNIFTFKTVTDRGANAGETDVTIKGKKIKARPFLIPEFAPTVVEFSYNSDTKKLTVLNKVPLKDEDGDPFTGLPPKAAEGQQMEAAVDTDLELLDTDEIGADSEGFCQVAEYKFVSDEYAPALYMFDKNLVLEKQWTPGKGLPVSFLKRRLNRGIEGLACDTQYAYLMLQSPLEGEEHVRLVQFDWHNETTVAEYLYPVDADRADKIGDIAIVSGQKFVVIEQNGKAGTEKGVRNLYLVDLGSAGPGGELKKEFLLNLNSVGLQNFEKIEGITVVDNSTVALIVDNDFGLTGNFDKQNQRYETKADPKSYFVLIQLPKPLF